MDRIIGNYKGDCENIHAQNGSKGLNDQKYPESEKWVGIIGVQNYVLLMKWLKGRQGILNSIAILQRFTILAFVESGGTGGR